MSQQPRTLFATREPDDLSTYLHRQLVGFAAFLLPAVVVLVNEVRPTPVLQGRLLESISAYYYTAGIAILVGGLVALTAFFVTYRGYNNKHRGRDLFAAWIAGGAAFLVAFFPTDAPLESLRPLWWAKWMGWTHFVAAAVLFLTLTYFSWTLFTKSGDGAKPTTYSGKWWRNLVHYVCAAAMAACVIWAAIAGYLSKPIFLPETIALMAFGLSWLVKGRVDTTIATVFSDPGAVVREVRRASRGNTTAAP